MVNDKYLRLAPSFLKKDLVQFSTQLLIPAIIGVIYGFMINDETTREYINQALHSQAGPDLHQYLPLVIAVFVYSYFIQKKQSNLLKRTILIFLHIFIAVLSFLSSLVVLLML